jgi:hypothetical protein
LMKKLRCPKCGTEVIGGSGFWGTSKPYCSFCGWNLQMAKEEERRSLKQLPWALVLFVSFFTFVGYLSKSGFALFPFLFLSVFLVGGAIASWRKLRLLEASHSPAIQTNTTPLVIATKENLQQAHINSYQCLWALTKPRRVRLKPVARVITIAFPVSWIFMVYFGFQIVRDEIAVSSPLATLRNLGPLLLFALLWSVIGITTIRRARRDRKLLAEGDLAIAIVTHQELSGGKHRTSQIQYEFKDAAGRSVYGDGADESRERYEDMEVLVFYDPEVPRRNVAICTATCELITN